MNFTMNTNECFICKIANNIFAIYSIILIVVATLGNLFSSYISYRLGQKNKSTFKILSFVFIFNSLTLYTWVLDIFLSIFDINKDFNRNIDSLNIIESLSIPTCKIFAFNQYFTLETISWLLVFLLVDQLLILYLPKLKYNVKLVCWLIIGFFILFNSHILIFAGKVNYLNSTILVNDSIMIETIQSVDCFRGETFNFYKLWPIWDQIHLFIYSFIPFVLMMLCNLFAIKKIIQYERTLGNEVSTQMKILKKNRIKRKLAIVLLISTFCFIVCSLPEIILFGYYFEFFSSNKERYLFLPASDLLNFTYIGFNFVIYLLKNKLFRNEFKFCWHQLKIRVGLKKSDFLYLIGIMTEEEYFVTQSRQLNQLTRKYFNRKLNLRKEKI